MTLSRIRPSVVALAVLVTLSFATADAFAWGTASYSVSKAKMDRALGCKGGKDKLDGKEKLNPVLLVHGTGITREESWQWNYWKALPAAGWEVCWVQLPKTAIEDLQISAEYVARAVQVMHRRTEERVDVIGHSQGGLVPRWSIKWFPSGRFVGDYIGLAAPNHGTESAEFGTIQGMAPPAFWQMRRDAKFVAAVNDGDETPGHIAYTSIYTATDELVQPVGTQDLDGAVNVLLQDLCPERNVEHGAILGDGLTYNLVVDALQHRGPAEVARIGENPCAATTVPGATAPPPEGPDYSQGELVDHEPPLRPYAR
jgi:triacylglycerol esterase/lipase EstA (alpha/beta hydrolase family)